MAGGWGYSVGELHGSVLSGGAIWKQQPRSHMFTADTTYCVIYIHK